MDTNANIYDEKKAESIYTPNLNNMDSSSDSSSYDSTGKSYNTDILTDPQNGVGNPESKSEYVSSFMTLGPNLSQQKDLEPIGYQFDVTPIGENECVEYSLSSADSFNYSNVSSSSVIGSRHSFIEGDVEHLVAEYEEKLKFSNQKLKIWEEEIVKLKDEKNSQENNVEMQRRVVTALQKKIIDLEACICDSDYEKQELVCELEANRERLSESSERFEKLKQDYKDEISKTTLRFQSQLDLAWSNVDLLEAQISNLHDRIEKSTVDINIRDDEIRKLNSSFSKAEEDFDRDKAQLCSNLEESRKENAELKTIQENLKVDFECHIEQIVAEFSTKGEGFEDLKLKFEKLARENDGFVTQIQKQIAEMEFKDIRIKELEGEKRLLQTENKKLGEKYGVSKKASEELRCEVERQKVALCDREENKREAIRQLCFALEHYRTEHQELLQTLLARNKKV